MYRISRIAVTLTLFTASTFFNALAETSSADSLCGDAERACNALKDEIRRNVKPRPGLALIQLETLVAKWPSEKAHCSKILQKLSSSKDVQAAAKLRRALEAMAAAPNDIQTDNAKKRAILDALPFVKSEFLGVAQEIAELSLNSEIADENIPNIKIDKETPIVIIGDDKFIEKTKTALSLIEKKAPSYYTVVTNCLSFIRRGNRSGIFPSASPPTVIFGLKTSRSSLTWYASAIVHEAYHRKLYTDYLKTFGAPVPANIYSEREGENSCLSAQEDFLKTINASEKKIKHLQKMRNVDYSSSEERDW